VRASSRRSPRRPVARRPIGTHRGDAS
jgi:hypothetical protein